MLRSGRAAPTSLPSLPNRCGRSSSIMPAATAPGNAEAVPGALSLDDTGLLEQGKGRDLDVVALDDALKALAQIDARKAQVVELRFFGGLNFDETAEVLKVSAVTVARDWSTARAWLHREMSRGISDGR